MSTQMERLTEAVAMLADARSLGEVVHIRNMAAAAGSYARAEKLGTEAMAYANEIKVRAARKAGELLVQMAETGERDLGHGGDRRSPSAPVTVKLADLDVSRNESTRWQRIASLSDETFERAAAGGSSETAIARLAVTADPSDPSPLDDRRARVALRRRDVMKLRDEGVQVEAIARRLALARSVVASDIHTMLAKHPEMRAKKKVLSEKQTMAGLQSAAVQLQSLAEVLDGDLLGDWSGLYGMDEAERWFDVIAESLTVVNSRLRRVLRERKGTA